MPKKPAVITIITLCFLFAPMAIIMQAAVFTNTPVIGPYNIFQKLAATDWMVIFIYSISAAAVYSVKKWGWYVYIICAAALVSYNTIVFILRPQYSVFIMILFNLALFSVAGIFFRRTVIAPYFNPVLRWWQQPSRFRINLSMQVGDGIGGKPSTCDIIDISASGAFAVSPEPLKQNVNYHLVIKCLRHTASLQGQVVRAASFHGRQGYGIRFLEHNVAVRKELETMFRDLKRAGLLSLERVSYKDPVLSRSPAPRYRPHIDTLIALPAGEYIANVVDISRGGCLLAAENGFCPPLDQTCMIT
ncbi:MAG: PilZ domain-containing protein, partial [Spirochaetaceae bacterium]